MIYQVLRCLAWCHKNSPHRLENLWLTDSNILLIWKINMFTQHPFPVDSWLSPNLKPAWLRSREHFQFSWVQSLSHVWLQSHGLQHTRLPCPSPTPRVYSNSSSSSWWCHPTISSSVVPFSCLQSFPSSQSFQMIQFFASGGQSIGVSASTSVLPMNIQDWSPLGWTGWISLQFKGLSRVFSSNTVQKHHFFGAQLCL